MKFETGKFYKTRDGRKAQIFMLDRGDGVMVGAVLNIVQGRWSICTWRMNGCWYDRQHELDLISEWREPIERKTVAWVEWREPFPGNYYDRLGINSMNSVKVGNCQHKVEIIVREIPE